MIGLDTNILVRYLTQDDPIQSAKATEIYRTTTQGRKPWFRQRCRDGRNPLGARSRLWLEKR
jgi:predicted nucleic-acid-binding protein